MDVWTYRYADKPNFSPFFRNIGSECSKTSIDSFYPCSFNFVQLVFSLLSIRSPKTQFLTASCSIFFPSFVVTLSFSLQVLIYPSGYVLWVPCSIFQSSCSIDVLYFPFDEQTCEMIFGSWTYNSKQVGTYCVVTNQLGSFPSDEF